MLGNGAYGLVVDRDSGRVSSVSPCKRMTFGAMDSAGGCRRTSWSCKAVLLNVFFLISVCFFVKNDL